jgi:hypothetical protein
MIMTSYPEPDGAAMNPTNRTTDPPPTSRRTVIINTAVALFARTGEQKSAAKRG